MRGLCAVVSCARRLTKEGAMFDWFDAKRAETFGQSLAQTLVEKLPPKSLTQESKTATKTTQVLTRMEAQIKTFREGGRLNVYKKAKLANAFRWALKDAVYDEPFIDKLVEWLVTQI
jgi:hypothetical protein